MTHKNINLTILGTLLLLMNILPCQCCIGSFNFCLKYVNEQFSSQLLMLESENVPFIQKCLAIHKCLGPWMLVPKAKNFKLPKDLLEDKTKHPEIPRLNDYTLTNWIRRLALEPRGTEDFAYLTTFYQIDATNIVTYLKKCVSTNSCLDTKRNQQWISSLDSCNTQFLECSGRCRQINNWFMNEFIKKQTPKSPVIGPVEKALSACFAT